MDLSTILGLVIAFIGIIGGYVIEGGNPVLLFVLPSPYMIVFGGTIGATLISFPLSDVKKMISALKEVFTSKNHNEIEIINEISALSEKARKDGLLSLESDAQNSKNDFMKKGLGLVVDGIEGDVIRDILNREIILRESIHETSARMFEAMGGFAPTMGVLGTVMGMVQVLGSMEDSSEGLGEKIAVAFLATLFGVGSANLFWLPFAGKIKAKAEKEKMAMELMIEGLLSIHAGENPRIIKEKLNLSLIEKMNGIKISGKTNTPADEKG